MKILFFRTGSLGDQLIAVPSIWAIRDAFPAGDFYLLSNSPAEGGRVSGKDLFERSDLFKGFLQYPSLGGGKWPFSGWRKAIRVWSDLRNLKLDAIVYLAPSQRTASQMWRDKLFF